MFILRYNSQPTIIILSMLKQKNLCQCYYDHTDKTSFTTIYLCKMTSLIMHKLLGFFHCFIMLTTKVLDHQTFREYLNTGPAAARVSCSISILG